MAKVQRSVVLLFAVALVAGLGVLGAQQAAPAIKRTVLLKQDVATIPGKEAVMVVVDLPVGAAEGKHTHAAEVFAYVVEGTILLEADGKPNATLKAGDYFYIAPGQIHQGTNTGTVPAKLSVVFVAEKGKPLTTPVQ
jgi:quercetin dioxygenase-like cupin family protein